VRFVGGKRCHAAQPVLVCAALLVLSREKHRNQGSIVPDARRTGNASTLLARMGL